ncbi:MAG: efflux RND transporter periplasmic adaptor subunit [Putridiphycobacter sp.]|nr:efflux RND transporter periplasmic adaptor subunit [Putridiphycobacter sp.]
MNRIIGIAVLVGLAALVVVTLKTNKTIAEERVYQYNKEAPITVYGQVVGSSNSAVNREFTGTFMPVNEVKINAEVQGAITKIYVKEGDVVKKGQTILKIDDQILRLKSNALKTQIKGLEKDVDRYQKLVAEDAIQAIKLEKTLLGLEAANAELATVQAQINKTVLRAPFRGVITKQFSEVGAFASPAMPLVELSTINQLKFVINVSEQELALFTANNKYQVVASSFSDMPLESALIYMSSKGNMANSFTVEFAIPITKNSPIKSNMFGTVRVNSTEVAQKGISSIPAKAIIGSQIKPEIYRVKNGKAALTPISIASRYGNFVEVSNGVQKGDTIVTSGFINLFNHANVTVVIDSEIK